MPRAQIAMLSVLFGVFLTTVALAEDWPTYQHDVSRSGVTTEQLALPLQQHWVYTPPSPPDPGWADPQPIPVEGVLEPPKVKFDDAFHVAVVGNLAFFSSTADDGVHCLDASTGARRWDFYTGGPVRLAPTIADGKAYFGSDDGNVYCLTAADGKLVWQRRVGPDNEQVLGHGRMVSLWPCRTGVLVDQGIAYFTAGIFPGERVYVCAAKADTGELIWTNDTISDQGTGQNGFSPQGYLLASETSLFVPSGRALPACFDRQDGRFLYQRNDGRWNYGVVGGTYALLSGEHLFGGTGQVLGFSQDSGALGFAWFPGKRLVLTAETSYMLNDAGIVALDRIKYPEISRKQRGLIDKRSALNSSKPKDLKEQLAALDEQDTKARDELAACTRWRTEREKLETMIVAGDLLIAGGDGVVLALSRADGKPVWELETEGVVRSIAVAGGRLYASTDRGTIVCMGAGPAPVAVAETAAPEAEAADVCARAADAIISQSGVKRGYCLVLGCTDGRLAAELARRTELRIYVADPDASDVQAARATLAAAGLYGSRVSVEQADLSDLPYSDYFANLVVSEEAVVSGQISASPSEVLRCLKPCGGTICLGQPENAAGGLSREALEAWLATASFDGAEITGADGLWAVFTRGKLPGAGSWTHQYGDPGNTASSEDTIVKCPLGVLWYGEPGPDKVPSRHAGNAAPLSINGRVYLQGINRIMCFDAYNGFSYWEKEIPGAYKVGMVNDCSNIACDDQGIFVSLGDRCVRLSAETGDELASYKLPPAEGDAKPRWAYMAVVDGMLYGSTSTKAQFSDSVFATDIKTGEIRWVWSGKSIRNNAIAISEGKLLLCDQSATPEQRQEALKAKVQELAERKKITGAEAAKELASCDVRNVFALDAVTGQVLWQRPVDLTDCGAHVLTGMASRGVLVFCGSHANGHYWPQFLGGEYAARRAVAVSTADGAPLWSKAIGYRIRPLIVGDELIAEPWAFDLQTGKQKMRAHPITGVESPWQFERPGHHCGCISGSANGLFFRSWSLAYYDTNADQGTEHFGGQRPGCWINMLPVNGLLVVPEASSGCICLVSIHCTTVFKPTDTHKAWGAISAPGATIPVKDLCLGLGAPGDRRAKDGKLWMSYPRPWGRMSVATKADVAFYAGGGYFSKAAETYDVQGAPEPWVFASGAAGIRSCAVPVVGPVDGPAVYTVRLGFTDDQNTAPGQRVFDIKLNGKVVEEGFDIIRVAGGPGKVVVREYKGVEVGDNLRLEFASNLKEPTRAQAPLLNTLELHRERVLAVGMSVPACAISDLDREQSIEVQFANRTEREFTGTLQISAPDGFSVTPETAAVSLTQNQELKVPVALAVVKPAKAAKLELRLRLLKADGTVESEQVGVLDYLGARGRMVITPTEDTYVSCGAPKTNYGSSATLLVDGGGSVMGDNSHNIAYLKFPLNIPGKPVSVRFRIHTSASEAAESNDSGIIALASDPWDENKAVYEGRSKPGKELVKLGKVDRDVWVERALDVDLTGLTELSLVLEPTSCDGASYVGREGGALSPQLVVEYQAE